MRDDLKMLEKLDYLVAEKSDGLRFLLLAVFDGKTAHSLLIDRGFRFFRTNITFDTSIFQGIGSLFDGEMVLEPTGMKLYLHDVVCLSGKTSVAQLNYVDRIRIVREVTMFYCFPSPDCNDMVQVLPKRIYPLHELPRLWENDIPNLAHRCDGLIFTPNSLPHKGQKSKQLFKWKRPQDHTVDLQIGEVMEPNASTVKTVFDKRRDGEKNWVQKEHEFGRLWSSVVLYTWDTKEKIFFCTTAMSPEKWAEIEIDDPNRFFGNIVECVYHTDKNMWIPIALRKDKLVPNDTHTVSFFQKKKKKCSNVIGVF